MPRLRGSWWCLGYGVRGRMPRLRESVAGCPGYGVRGRMLRLRESAAGCLGYGGPRQDAPVTFAGPLCSGFNRVVVFRATFYVEPVVDRFQDLFDFCDQSFIDGFFGPVDPLSDSVGIR